MNAIQKLKGTSIELGNFEQRIGTEQCAAIVERLQQTPQEIKAAWNACVDDFKVLSTTYKGMACYLSAKRGININLESITKDRKFDFRRGEEVYNQSNW